MTNNYLYHHGILGMKWGIRRYQNEDGTLTEAGKKRLRKQDDKFIRRYPDKAKNASQYKQKEISDKEHHIKFSGDTISEYTKLKNEDLSKKDFIDEAKSELKGIKEAREEDKDYRGEKISEQDTINWFFWSLGIEPPEKATISDVAKELKEDQLILQRNHYYDKAISEYQEEIKKAKKEIQKIQDTPLKEIYERYHKM